LRLPPKSNCIKNSHIPQLIPQQVLRVPFDLFGVVEIMGESHRACSVFGYFHAGLAPDYAE
jgi:hypothetical protein